MKQIIKKTRLVNFVLYKLSTILDPKAMKVIYQALFESIVNYRIIAWGGAYDNKTKPLTTILIKKIKVEPILSIDKSFIVNSVVYYYDICRIMYNEHSGRSRYR